ncbi:MAG: hypothetical protein ACLFS6_02065 [Methanomassiliicoccales archaeon]
MDRARTLLAVTMVTLFLLAMIVQPHPGPDCRVEGGVSVEDGIMTVEVEYQIDRTEYDKNTHLLCFPVQKDVEGPIYIYLDYQDSEDYSHRRAIGLYDHLRAEMALMGSDAEIVLVEDEELDEVFNDPNATLIMTKGTDGGSLTGLRALDWVHRGGTIIGLGEEAIPFVDPPREKKHPSFMELSYWKLDFIGGEGMEASPPAAAFDFDLVAPAGALDMRWVEANDGRPIGYLYDRGANLTSAAMFSMGEGRVVAFGGKLDPPQITTGEDAVANDIAHLLISGYVWSTGEMYWEEVAIDGEESAGTLSLEFPRAEGVSLALFDTDIYDRLSCSRTVMIDDQSSDLVDSTILQI